MTWPLLQITIRCGQGVDGLVGGDPSRINEPAAVAPVIESEIDFPE